MAKIYPCVVDLSHWDPADDYNKVRQAGIVGVIYKATQSVNYSDPTYTRQQSAAKAAGLKWGSYHFADGTGWQAQAENYLRFASPDPDELFCLDWEDNPGGHGKMNVDGAQQWITKVETELGRPGQCVIYSGNTAKELLGKTVHDFFGARRLWLCHYTSGTPRWQASWDTYWLWQFTDGEAGPEPHRIPGIGACDINSYDQGPIEQLIAEWATGEAQPEPAPGPDDEIAAVNIVTEGKVRVSVNGKVVS